MIKKIVGILFAIASIAVMAFVIMNRGNFRSLLTIEPATKIAQPTAITSNEKSAQGDLSAQTTQVQPTETSIEESDSTKVKHEEPHL